MNELPLGILVFLALIFAVFALGCYSDIVKYKKATGFLNIFALLMAIFFVGLSAVCLYKIVT